MRTSNFQHYATSLRELRHRLAVRTDLGDYGPPLRPGGAGRRHHATSSLRDASLPSSTSVPRSDSLPSSSGEERLPPPPALAPGRLAHTQRAGTVSPTDSARTVSPLATARAASPSVTARTASPSMHASPHRSQPPLRKGGPVSRLLSVDSDPFQAVPAAAQLPSPHCTTTIGSLSRSASADSDVTMRLQKELSEASLAVRSLEGELADTRSQLRRSVSQLAQRDEELGALEAQLFDFRSSTSRCDAVAQTDDAPVGGAERKDLQLEILRLGGALDESQQRLEDRNRACAVLERRLAEAESDAVALRQLQDRGASAAVDSNVRRMEEEAQRVLQAREEHHAAEKREMLGVYESLKAELEDARRSVASVSRQTPDDELAELQGLRRQLQSLRSENDVLRSAPSEAAAAAAVDRRRAQAADDRAADTAAKLRAAEEELKLLRDEYDAAAACHSEATAMLERSLVDARAEVEHYLAAADTEAVKVRQLHRQLAEAEAARSAAEQLGADAEAQISALRAAAATAVEEGERAERRASELTQRFDAGASELATTRAAAAAAAERADSAGSRVKEAEEEAERQRKLRRTAEEEADTLRRERAALVAAAKEAAAREEEATRAASTQLSPLRRRVAQESRRRSELEGTVAAAEAALYAAVPPDAIQTPLATMAAAASDRVRALIEAKDAAAAELSRTRAEQAGAAAEFEQLAAQSRDAAERAETAEDEFMALRTKCKQEVDALRVALKHEETLREDVERLLRQERDEHASLRDRVESTDEVADDLQSKLEMLAGAEQTARETADDAFRRAAEAEALLADGETRMQAMEERHREELAAAAAQQEARRRALLQRVATTRADERRAHELALVELSELQRRQAAQRGLLDTLQRELCAVVAAAEEGSSAAATHISAGDRLADVVAELRSAAAEEAELLCAELASARQQARTMREDAALQRGLAAQATQQCTTLSAELAEAQVQRRELEDQLATERSARISADERLRCTESSQEQERAIETQARDARERAAAEEVSHAHAQVQELRQQLQRARKRRDELHAENGELSQIVAAFKRGGPARPAPRLSDSKSVCKRVVAKSPGVCLSPSPFTDLHPNTT
eukprot:TRINITY_DN15529_c0_g1_i1.p1 TRINITY_DN15529_c0_g1~~TRINITY_DN15529_c0_g1_i1.p1  ORF type:complete len:1103 (+),score=356.13 TRINITY_DN15529_c0_g1_i1:42-3350(+)